LGVYSVYKSNQILWVKKIFRKVDVDYTLKGDFFNRLLIFGVEI